jgi:hypothetical protein
MTPRLVPLTVGAAAFAVTLLWSAGHGGLWPQPAEPAVRAPPVALRSMPVPVEATPAPPALPPAAASPVPAGALVAASDDDEAAATPEVAVPPAALRESAERQRQEPRGARTR